MKPRRESELVQHASKKLLHVKLLRKEMQKVSLKPPMGITLLRVNLTTEKLCL